MKKRSAFTLIELLVVIAIIAILAAILFPVFAQAKAAAKTTQSISNMKQVGIGLQMYLSDNEDTYPQRRFPGVDAATNQPTLFSWKYVTYPYIKSSPLFTDTVNQAAKYPDDTGDPLLMSGLAIAQPVFARGYAFADIPWLLQKSWSATTLTSTAVDNPAGTLVIAEQKRAWVDTGPYLNWTPDPQYPGDPTAGFKYPWGGNKWDDKAMVLIFHDSHAKRAANGAICGKDNELNMWGYQRDQLSNWGGLGDVTWLDTFCQTMPPEVK